MTPVTPTAPIAPWLGGKRNLAKRICARLDAMTCTTYAEPFVGMGGIFLRSIGGARARLGIGLMNLTYNLKRIETLIRLKVFDFDRVGAPGMRGTA